MVSAHRARASPHANADTQPRITVYQPAFLSQEDPVLGQNVGTVINTAIWRTFRKAPAQSNAVLSGDATAAFGNRALELAQGRGAQIVVWGNAFKYGDGGIGNAHINILAPTQADRLAQVWEVEVTLKNRRLKLLTDLFPERSLYFQPLIFTGDLLTRYASPRLDEVYDDPQGSHVIGTVTSDVTALEFGERSIRVSIPDAKNPKGPQLIGYMLLPAPVEGTSAVTNFTGAIVAILRQRGDWATSLLEKVESDRQTPSNIRIDSKVLRALCLVKLGKTADGVIEDALRLNPTARRTLVAKVMVRLTELTQGSGEGVPTFHER